MATLSVRGKRYEYATVPGYNVPVEYKLFRGGSEIGNVRIDQARKPPAKIAPGVGATQEDLDVLSLLGTLLEDPKIRPMPLPITVPPSAANPFPFSCPYKGCGKPSSVNFHVDGEVVLTYPGCGHWVYVTIKIT